MNILPQFEKDEIKKGYKMRIIIICFWATFTALTLSSIFLLPVYIIVNSKLYETSKKKEVISKATKEQTEIVDAPKIINKKAILALQSVNSISVATRVTKIHDANTQGITINKISYEDKAKTKTEKPNYKVTVYGIAPNRESLVSFEKAIGQIDFVKDTSIPVGDFARFKDLVFTMTINIINE